MKKYKIISFLITMVMIMSLSVTIIKADTVTTITADKVTTDSRNISVPIRLSGNPGGICGAAITVSYDKALTLTKIESSEALSSLTMTKPGKLSDNPIKLVWDGLEADNTNGVIATLNFTVPQDTGIYNISISCEDGDVVDGNLSPINVSTENGSITVSGEITEQKPTISIGSVMAKAGSQIKLPISISGNTGICGATLEISYDSALVLSDISTGTALSSLVMTKPGNISSNPFKLVWDGLDADFSNGTIAVLTFTAPTEIGSYNISAAYTDGDIVDGDLSPVDMKINQGQIKVEMAESVTIEIGGKQVNLPEVISSNNILIAFYENSGTMISVKSYSAKDIPIKVTDTQNAAYAKVMVWESLNTLKPVCGAQTVNLK